MTPERFAELLQALGWNNSSLALMLECDERLVRRWRSGTAAIPPSIARWLERLALFHEKHPAPDDWRVR